MKSRTLPACRTDAMVLSKTHMLERDDHVLCDTPDCRATWYGHRLVLDAPPTDPDAWFARWRAEHGDTGVRRAYLVWEHRLPSPVPVPADAELVQHRVMMHDQWEDPTPPTAALRPLTEADAGALLDLMRDEHGTGEDEMERYLQWYTDQLWAHRARDRGFLWGAFAGTELVGTAGLVFDRAEARLQNVLVAPAHRRKGLATRLITAVLGDYRDQSMGIVYLVVRDGSPAEQLYRSLEFRHVTWFWELSKPV